MAQAPYAGPKVARFVAIAIALMLALLTGVCFFQPSQPDPRNIGRVLDTTDPPAGRAVAGRPSVSSGRRFR